MLSGPAPDRSFVKDDTGQRTDGDDGRKGKKEEAHKNHLRLEQTLGLKKSLQDERIAGGRGHTKIALPAR